MNKKNAAVFLVADERTKTIEAESVSGDLALLLPENVHYKLNMKKLSSGINNLKATLQDENYIDIKFDSVVGDINFTDWR